LTGAPPKRVLFLAQTVDGVVFGFFANCPLSGEGGGRDPALKSALFVLDHPTFEQRKWQLQNPNYRARAFADKCVCFGTGLMVTANGGLMIAPAPEFGMTEVDASFVSLRPASKDGRSFGRIVRWELWSV
jgi:hypothetical protein